VFLEFRRRAGELVEGNDGRRQHESQALLRGTETLRWNAIVGR
jgi:hypothetical protein